MTAEEIRKELNIKENVKLSDKDSGFYAGFYRNDETGEYALAFRGTNEVLKDFGKGNIPNLNDSSPQYKHAVELATQLSSAVGTSRKFKNYIAPTL